MLPRSVQEQQITAAQPPPMLPLQDALSLEAGAQCGQKRSSEEAEQVQRPIDDGMTDIDGDLSGLWDEDRKSAKTR